jgi:hypothetical protein
LKLQPNAPFTAKFWARILLIKQALIVKGFMAPQLEDPEVQFDSATNAINIVLKGKVGPLVEISFSPNYNLKESKQQKLRRLSAREIWTLRFWMKARAGYGSSFRSRDISLLMLSRAVP